MFAYHSTASYQRFYPHAGSTPADAQALVERFIQWQKEKPRWRFQWAVTQLNQSEQNRNQQNPLSLIGNCGIRRSTPGSLEAEIGCELAPQFWGRNYPVEMGQFLLQFGFEQLGLERIFAHCIAQNRGAVFMAEKLGMKVEERLPANVQIRAEWHDALIYGIHRQQWDSQRNL